MRTVKLIKNEFKQPKKITSNSRWQIKIKDEWQKLCACINCKEVHACGTDVNGWKMDEFLKCCENPNNHFGLCAVPMINRFVKKWEDK